MFFFIINKTPIQVGMSNDIILFFVETIMGTEMNAQEGKSTQYVHSIKRYTYILK